MQIPIKRTWFRLIRNIILLSLVISGMPGAKAQFYSIGQDPATIKWLQIHSEHFRVVFPEDFSQRARYVTSFLETTYDSATYILQHKPKQIPVIIHNREITPNALTIWAPRRIEMYACPPQNIYAQDWLEQLAIHEYEHVIQFDRLNKGTTRVLSWFLGEIAPPVIAGIFIPAWFLEGDAVFAETVLSKSGRGRMPDFEMELKALVKEKKKYSYDKAVFGSYKDFVPDHYVLGYHMVTNVRRKYGIEAWNKSLDLTASKPYLITPFNRGLKLSTGKNKVELYRQTLHDLDSIWTGIKSRVSETPCKAFSTADQRDYVRYKFPNYINDSLILAERMSLDDIPRFVLIDRKGNEKIVCTPGFFSSEAFSFSSSSGLGWSSNKPGTIVDDEISLSKGLLSWAEKEADPRWQNRSYSVIKTYDFKTGKMRKISARSRYFSPAVSPDGKFIVVVEITENNIFSLVLLDSQTGEAAETLYSSATATILTPSWSEDGKKIAFVQLTQDGKSLMELSMMTGKTKTLFQAGFNEIDNPVYCRGYIFMNGSFSGTLNIFALDTLTRQVYQVTSAPYGGCNAQSHPGTGKIVYSDYQGNGFRIVETEFDPGSWKKLESISSNPTLLFSNGLKPGQFTIDSASVRHIQYPTEKYNKLAHFFRFHSWSPVYINALNGEVKPGLSLMSQNDLSTATLIAGYEWDYGEKTGRGRISLNWEGWYPVFDFDGSYGNRTRYENVEGNYLHAYTWDESQMSLGVKLPLFYNHGVSYSGLTLLAHTSIISIHHNTSISDDKLEGNINSLDYRLIYYRYRKQSMRDLYPKWGIYTDFNFRHSPWGDNDLGSVASAAGTFFVPGLFDHHGLRIYTAYQHRDRGDYEYQDLVSMPRGYHFISSEESFSLRLTYKMPVACPDLALGSMVYIKRVKSGFFYDYSNLREKDSFQDIQSFGLELTGDMHLLRFMFPVDPGIRIGYKPGEKQWFAEPMFSVNLSF